MTTDYTINIENNFCNRFTRQLEIKMGSTTMTFPEMDSRSPEAHKLALDLMFAASCILNHHELP